MNRDLAGDCDRWHVLGSLGQGGEGAVYLVVDKTTSQRWVLKSFHSPLSASQMRALRRYESGIVGEDCPGLPMIKLVCDQDWIHGVRYQHIALHRVHWRLLRSVCQLGQALVGSYCRMQHHLISQHGIAIWDASLKNFMLARNGHFYWIDFGKGMEVVEHLPPDQCLGGFEYGFARLLAGVHGVYFRSVASYSECYTYAGPCTYFMHPVFDDIAEECDWARDLVEMVRGQRASAFLQAEFYKQLGMRLPTRVSMPMAVIASSALLFRLSELRARLRNS
jgi:hypothetical protein